MTHTRNTKHPRPGASRLRPNGWKALLTAIMIIALASASAMADSSPAYNFLNIPTSTRIYGLGGVNITTIDDNIETIDQNPALLGPEFEMQASFNYMRYIGESNFAGLRFANSVGEQSAWAIGLQYFGYGTLKETDAAGNILGDFSPKDVSFSGAYSHNLSERWRGGFNLKFLYSTYGDYTAFALATDLGVNYYDPDRDLSFSAVVANLGGQIKRFDEAYDRLPVDVRLGWAQSFGTFPVRFSITAWNLTRWNLPYVDPGDGTTTSEAKIVDNFKSNLFRHLVFGADLIPSEKFNLGIGYNYKTRTDMATYSRNFLSGFSLCAGLKVSSCNLGIALAQPHAGASTFMFNIGLNLTQLMNR